MTEIKYKSEHIGRGGISARVVAHSKSAYSGQEIITWEYEAPKCILAEINTHRQFSRNAQSSRAVPVNKVIEQIRNNPVTPIYWGANQGGMVAGEEIDNEVTLSEWDGNYDYPRDDAWIKTAYHVANLMQAWENAGYHKQIVNRIGEAFTFVRGVISATELDNFFHLRIHPAADPFMAELAECMYQAYIKSEAEVLYEGEWHTPYYEDGYWKESDPVKFYEDGTPVLHQDSQGISLGWALKVSAAACAQVSFRKLDLSDETVDRVYSRLVDDETPHASCVEHQATPIKYNFENARSSTVYWPEGVSHMDREGDYWSGNFKHWIQNRKLIPNESRNNYVRKEINE
jgi:hypothetical protein